MRLFGPHRHPQLAALRRDRFARIRRRGLRPDAMGHVGRQKMVAKRLQQAAVDASAVGEADFQFGRVNVDVDQLRRHRHPKETHRVAADHQQPAVGFTKGVLQRAIADVASVEKQVLHAGVAAADRRVTDVTLNADLRIIAVDGDQGFGDFAAEERFDPVAPTMGDRQIVQRLVVVDQHEVDVRVGQRDPREGFDDVALFRLGGFQEAMANGRVEKQIADLHDRPDRTAAGLSRLDDSAADSQFVARRFTGRAAADGQLRDAADRRECLAAKPQRLNMKQRFIGGQLAGGVTGNGQRQLIGRHAAAVIADADQFGTAADDRYFNPCGAGVDAVFQQFFDNRGGPFDHFAGGDLVDQVGRQLSDDRSCRGAAIHTSNVNAWPRTDQPLKSQCDTELRR